MLMLDDLQRLESMVSALLAQEPLPTPDRIRELLASLRLIPICSNVTDDQAEGLARVLEERHGVTMQLGSTLKGERWEPWLDAARPQITPYYWDRYRKLLVEKGFSGQVIASIDQITERILGLLENPNKPGPCDRRGKVVGRSQSAKT